MAHLVKCSVCGQTFDRDKHPFEQTSSKRYAHKACAEIKKASQTQDEEHKTILDNYICELFKTDYVEPRVRKQINHFIKEYNYTYNGIYKSLKYWFEVKHNDISKANGGIGIVPYIYNDAKNYYYAIWLAQEQNKNKIETIGRPKEREVRIRRPERRVKRLRKFGFLDEEGERK